MDEDGVRLVVFAHGGLHVRLAISRARGRWDLNGTVDPPRSGPSLSWKHRPSPSPRMPRAGGSPPRECPGGVMRLVAAEAAETVRSDWFNV